jgi:hypothetical protein
VPHHSAKCNYAKCHCAKQNYLNGTNVLLKNKICDTKIDPVKHDTPACHITQRSGIMINVALPSKHTSMKKVLLQKYNFLLQNKITNPLCQIPLLIFILLNATPSNKNTFKFYWKFYCNKIIFCSKIKLPNISLLCHIILLSVIMLMS